MPQKLDELAAAIADRALARLRGEGSGNSASLPETDCAPGGCEPCPQIHSCGARALFEEGATRLTPTAIRTSKDLAQVIDHTMLKPDAAREDIEGLCREALQFCFASVCVNPISRAATRIAEISSSGGRLFSRNPLAPARSAR